MARGRAARPGVGWELHEQPDGTVDVRLDGRPVWHDRDDVEDAVREIGRSRQGQGAPVTHVDPEGYREALR